MDEFLTKLWIEEEIVEINTPEVKPKNKKKKNPSPEKLERRRLQMEFEEQCRIKREEKRKRHEENIKRLHGNNPKPWFSSLVKLTNWNYRQCVASKVYQVMKYVFKFWWELLHIRPVENMTLAKNVWKIKNRKYRVAPWEYNLPDDIVSRILSLTK